jgi:hypothetical protein
MVKIGPYEFLRKNQVSLEEQIGDRRDRGVHCLREDRMGSLDVKENGSVIFVPLRREKEQTNGK